MAQVLNNIYADDGFDLAEKFYDFVAAVRAANHQRIVFNETFRSLARLDDRELADIGLVRSDIEVIARERAAQAN